MPSSNSALCLESYTVIAMTVYQETGEIMLFHSDMVLGAVNALEPVSINPCVLLLVGPFY